MTDSDVRKNRTSDMPMEIWAELRGDILGYYYRGEPLNKNRATKYLLFSAHEEEVNELKAEVERLTAREQKWLELVELLYEDGSGYEIPDHGKYTKMRELRSELMEQEQGGEG